MREIVITMGEEATKTFYRILEEEMKKEVIRFRKEHICRYCGSKTNQPDSECYARRDYDFDGKVIVRLRRVLKRNKGNGYFKRFRGV
jgi:hypothetical protein